MKPEMYELLHKIIKDRAEYHTDDAAKFYYTNMLEMLELAKDGNYEVLKQYDYYDSGFLF